ncbi:hypothetical protein PWR66_03345 [Paraburkholderia sp. A1RO-5]|uniref:hypothetical protein n=1 Tax=Paraburkholderia sp. A1RO-5 TaxID=3028369 RepID=UPI003B7BD3B5
MNQSIPNAGQPPGHLTVEPDSSGIVPIFIHSSFRTSSTWLWGAFRRLPETWAYCEIFHEALASMTVDEARKVNYQHWASGHPPSAPYFFEFTPMFRPEGGIATFHPSMSYERFFPEDGPSGNLSAEECAHINALIENARSLGCRPILTDTRTLGRMQAIKAAYPSVTILLVRNIFHQWSSYSSQAMMGNPYFISMTDRIVRASGHDVFSRSLNDWYKDRRTESDNEAMFKTFLIHHLYLYAHAFDSADLILDVNAIARDSALRNDQEREIYSKTKLNINLSSVETNFTMTNLKIGNKLDFFDEIEQWMKRIGASGASSSGVRFAARMKDEALEELDRWSFYAQGISKYYVTLLKKEEACRQDCQTRMQEHEQESAKMLVQIQAQTEACTQMQKQIRAQEQTYTEVQAQMQTQAQRSAETQTRLQTILQSSSWRITQPLRATKQLLLGRRKT